MENLVDSYLKEISDTVNEVGRHVGHKCTKSMNHGGFGDFRALTECIETLWASLLIWIEHYRMFKSLGSLWGPVFPYTVEATPCDSRCWGGQWAHYRGVSKDDNSAVSIFKIEAADANDKKMIAARNGVKRSKTLKHPNILAYRDSHELLEKGNTVIYLITQPVTPLKQIVRAVMPFAPMLPPLIHNIRPRRLMSSTWRARLEMSTLPWSSFT